MRAEADLPPVRLDGDVAVGALLRERLGDEVVDRLVEPLLGGVYAGRADELSLQATMPALAAAPAGRRVGRCGAAAAARDAGVRSRGDDDGPVFVTVSDGIGSLPAALVAAAGAEVRLRTPAHGLRRTAGGFELSVGSAAEPELLTADAVLVTAPALKAARLLARGGPRGGRAAGRHPVRVDGRRRHGVPRPGRRRRVGAARAAGDRSDPFALLELVAYCSTTAVETGSMSSPRTTAAGSGCASVSSRRR